MQPIRISIIKKLSVLVIASVVLSGCQGYNPVTTSQIYPVKMRLQQATTSEAFLIKNRPDTKRLKEIANHYNKTSDGVMTLELHYSSRIKGQAERAVQTASKYKRLMREYGVRNTNVEMIPHSDGSQKVAEIKLSYKAWKTDAPVGCDPNHIPGYHGAEGPEAVNDYKMGCEIETYLSKMVVRPKDLAGTEGIDDGDSRREGNVVENYKTGEPNEPLGGLEASNVEGSQ